MAKYYKWYKNLHIKDEYAFAIPIILRSDATVTITIYSKLGRQQDMWQVETAYIPPTEWTGMIAIDSTDKKVIYNTLKGQKGEIITKIFALVNKL